MGFWFAIFLLVATTVVSALLQKHPKDATAAGRGDFTVPTAEAGRPIPVAFGTVKLQGPNVTWWGDLVVQPIRVSSGGFMGIGAKKVTTGYQYFVGMMLALCHGPVDAIVQVLVGDVDMKATQTVVGAPEDYTKLSIAQSDVFGGNDKEGGIGGTVAFYRGLTTQNSNAYLTTQLARTAPAYRNLCYAVLQRCYIGTSQYLKNWAFVVRRCPNPLGLPNGWHQISPVPIFTSACLTGNGFLSDMATYIGAGTDSYALLATDSTHFTVTRKSSNTVIGTATVGSTFAAYDGTYGGIQFLINAGTITFAAGDSFLIQTDGGLDANPACVVYEIMTSTSYGLGIPTSRFDTTSFYNAGVTLASEAFGVSFIMDSNTTADNVLSDLSRTCDFVLYTDPATGLWTMKLVRNDYTVGTLPEFTIDDMIEAPKFTRGSWSETINEAKIEFISRAQGFNPQIAQAQESANYAVRGETASENFSFHAISNAATAQNIASREIKTHSYPLAHFTVKLNRKGWSLRPGSVFKLTWVPPTGPTFVGLVVRCMAIRYGDMGNPAIEVDVCEDIFQVAASAYSPPGPSGWADPITNPIPCASTFALETPYQIAGADRWALTVAARGDGTSYQGEVWVNEAGGGYFKGNVLDYFTPWGVLAAPYSAKTPATDGVGFTLAVGNKDMSRCVSDTTNSLGLMNGNNLAIFPDTGEIIGWTTCTDNGDGTFTFSGILRGALDTVPTDHSAGAEVFFMSQGSATTRTSPYAADLSLAVKVLPRNTRGLVTIGAATAANLTTSSRALKPYPPGNVQMNGQNLASWPTTTTGDATLTWSHRNRTYQGVATTLVAQDSAASFPLEGNIHIAISVGGTLKRSFDTTGTSIPSGVTGVGNLNGLAMLDTNTWIVPTSNDQTTVPSRLLSITASGVANFSGSATAIGEVDGTAASSRFQGSTCSVLYGGYIFTLDKKSIVRRTDSSGNTITYLDLSYIGFVTSIAFDGSGNMYFFSNANCILYKVTPGLVVSVLAGSSSGPMHDGTGSGAGFQTDCKIACDSSGNVFVMETWGGGTTLGTLRYVTPAGVVSTIRASAGENFSQMAVIGSDLYAAGIHDRMSSIWMGVAKFTPAGVRTTLMSYTYGTFGSFMSVAVDPGGFLAFAGVNTDGNPMIGRITSGGVTSIVYTTPPGGFYRAVDRIADDPDGTKTVSMVLSPVNGSLTGTTRTLPSFTMTGFGMTFGNYFGGVQA